MKLKLYQVGEPVLRRAGRELSVEEILSPSIQQLIALMRETMRDAPGVGLAAPQVGESIQLAVIEDPAELLGNLPADALVDRDRVAVPFHVIINPRLTIMGSGSASYFEGCLSLAGFQAIVPRSLTVRVKCLNEKAEPLVINAKGWYARILQHEIEHLQGRLFIDRMEPRSLTTVENYARYWRDLSIEELRALLRP
jgi:peptide deformylase